MRCFTRFVFPWPESSDASNENSSQEDIFFTGVKKTKQPAFDISWDDALKELSYVDYRNCRCMEAVNYTFAKLHHHIANSSAVSFSLQCRILLAPITKIHFSEDMKRLTKFAMEYSAGLIETAQPLYLTKYLAYTAAAISAAEAKQIVNLDTPDGKLDKGMSLVLMGTFEVEFKWP